MKNTTRIFSGLAILMVIGCLAPGVGFAEEQKSLAATLKVYVFPSAGQDASQQSKDESECYDWAVQKSGIDPFELSKKAAAQEQQGKEAQQQASQVGKGAGVAGAARGAAAGALIGEIADDDAGKGAAIGATVGVVGGRRKGRRAGYVAQETTKQQTEKTAAYNEEQMSNFKKAFSACLEGKNYKVEF